MLKAEEFQAISQELNFLREDVDHVIEEQHDVIPHMTPGGPQKKVRSRGLYKTKQGYFRVAAKLTSNWTVAYSVTHRTQDATIVIFDKTQGALVRPLLTWTEPRQRRLRRAGSDVPLGEYSHVDIKLRRESLGETDLSRDCFRVYTSAMKNWILVVGPGVSEQPKEPALPVVKTIYIPSFTSKKLTLKDPRGGFWPATATFCSEKANETCVAMVRTRRRFINMQTLHADYGDLILYDVETEEILQEYSEEPISSKHLTFLLHGKQLLTVSDPQLLKKKVSTKPKSIIVFVTDSLTPVLRIPIDEFGSIDNIFPLYSLCGSSLALFITVPKDSQETKAQTIKSNTFPKRIKSVDTTKKDTIHQLLKRLSLTCIKSAAFDSLKEAPESDPEEPLRVVKVYDVPASNVVLPLQHLASMVVAQEAPSSGWKELPLSKDLKKYISFMKQY